MTGSAVVARMAPFGCFILLTFAQRYAGDAGASWLYLGKTLLVAWMLWVVRQVVTEMRWKLSWEGIVLGLAVFVIWVGLYPLLVQFGFSHSYPKLKTGPGWNPHAIFGSGSALAWFFIVVRIVGSSLVVPPMEEVFFRSFFYRYVASVDFLSVPLGAWRALPFLVTSIVFGLEHREWIAGILCGLAYQGLVCWKKRLHDAITAHAVTNLLLGLWVVLRGQWQFW